MPLNIQTLSQTRNQIVADIELRGEQAGKVFDAKTPGTGWTELAIAVAGVANGLYLNQRWLVAQMFVSSMDETTLKARAAEKGITQIIAAHATGSATVTGTDGKVITAGELLQDDNQQEFVVMINATIAAGTATVLLRAVTAGISGNLAVGAELTFIAGVSGVDSTATVIVLAAGADFESIERLRSRFLERLQSPPMGGADADYIAWSKQASVDVTRVFISRHEDSVGELILRVVTENLASAAPLQPLLDTINDHIHQSHIKPAGAVVRVEAPTLLPLDLVFTALSPNTPEVQAAIEAEVNDLLRQEGKTNFTLPLSHIREAISNAPGEVDYTLTLNADVVVAIDEFVVWGNPTWP